MYQYHCNKQRLLCHHQNKNQYFLLMFIVGCCLLKTIYDMLALLIMKFEKRIDRGFKDPRDNPEYFFHFIGG